MGEPQSGPHDSPGSWRDRETQSDGQPLPVQPPTNPPLPALQLPLTSNEDPILDADYTAHALQPTKTTSANNHMEKDKRQVDRHSLPNRNLGSSLPLLIPCKWHMGVGQCPKFRWSISNNRHSYETITKPDVFDRQNEGPTYTTLITTYNKGSNPGSLSAPGTAL